VCRQNYSYHAPLFATGEQFSLRRTVENFAPIATRIAKRKTDKLLRAAATLCLRGTRGSKIRNRPRNQIVRRDNAGPDVIDRTVLSSTEFSAVNDTAIYFSLPGHASGNHDFPILWCCFIRISFYFDRGKICLNIFIYAIIVWFKLYKMLQI